MKSSQPGYKKITKNSQEGLNQDNICYLVLANNSQFEVLARDKKMGEITLVPGIPFKVEIHPDYPFDVLFTFEFISDNELDYITATYIKVYVNS